MVRLGGRLKSVTLEDVAREARVSTSTVSRVISRPDLVGAETAERVQEAIDRLGYRSQLPHRSRPSRLQSIAVLTFALDHPFQWPLFTAIQDEARRHGFEVFVLDAQSHPAFERPKIQGVLQVVAGVVMISPRASEMAILQIAKQRPTVVINRQVRGVTCVLQDTSDGMRQAVDHLVGLGHRSLVYLGWNGGGQLDLARHDAVERRCRERGLAFRAVMDADYLPGAMARAFEAWHRSPSTAVLTFSDDFAMEFIRSAQRAGLRVPEDVSVIGVDNLLVDEYLNPRLTSVAVATDEQGVAAVQALLSRVVTGRLPAPPITPMSLVIRDSTGPAPA